MRHLLFITALLAVAFMTPLEAGTVQCVPTQGCPKGSKPPACCQPPPCEVYEQIKMKQTLRYYYRNKDVHKLLLKQAGGDSSKAADLLSDWVAEKAKNLGKELRCKWEAPHGNAATFETKAWCQIFVKYSEENQESMSERQAHEKFDTCAEFISAIYVHEGHHKQMCMDSDEAKRANMGLTAFAKEESEGYRREIRSLKASLQQYWRACSTKADAATARKLADAGISMLKKKAPKKSGTKRRNPRLVRAAAR